MTKTLAEQFNTLFPSTKALTFRAEPIGDSAKNLTEFVTYKYNTATTFNAFEQAELTKAEVKDAQELFNRMHKAYIERKLPSLNIDWTDVERQYRIAHAKSSEGVSKDDKTEAYKNLRAVQEKISNHLTSDADLKKYLSGKVIENLDESLYSPKEIEFLSSFKGRTGYFTNYFNFRAAMYEYGKSGTIAQRIVKDNFPLFMANADKYAELVSLIPNLSKALNELLESKFNTKLEADDFFKIPFFGKFVTQSGIDMYNTLINGYSTEKEKIQGLNEIVNLYSQQKFEKEDERKDFMRKYRMSSLQKQILSEKKKVSFVDTKLTNEAEAQQMFKAVVESFDNEYKEVKSLLKMLLDNANIVAMDERKLNNMSNDATGDWNTLGNMLKEEMFGSTSLNNKQIKEFKETKFTLDKVGTLLGTDELKKVFDKYLAEFDVSATDVLFKLNKGTLKENAPDVARYLNSINSALNKIRFFELIDMSNTELNDKWTEFQDFAHDIKRSYNKLRNWTTKKEYSQDMLTLDFGHAAFGSGLAETKLKQNWLMYMQRDNNYFIAYGQYIDTLPLSDEMHDGDYTALLPQNVDMPKQFKRTFITNEVAKHFEKSNTDYELHTKTMSAPLTITKRIYDIAVSDLHKTDKNALKEWLEFAVKAIPTYKAWEFIDLSQFDITTYTRAIDFFTDIKETTVSISHKYVAESVINEWIKEKKLYVFRLVNRDMVNGEGVIEKPSTLFTKYFLASITEGTNCRLQGNIKFKFRKASIEPKVHKKGSYLVNKRLKETTDKDGNVVYGEHIPGQFYINIYNNANYGEPLTSETEEYMKKVGKDNIIIKKAPFDIAKNKRYTEDQYFFTCPVQLCVRPERNLSPREFNEEILEYIKENADDVKILGIDRGERNLLNITLTSSDGKKIYLQKSLNIINGINYQKLLADMARQNKVDRSINWLYENSTKNIKRGYLSNAVKMIVDLAINNNAIIVMEALNSAFIDKRKQFDQQIYQEFQSALLSKLKCVVFRSKKDGEIGSSGRPIQLVHAKTSVAASDSAMQKGIVFFVPAANTSNVDPTTGFISSFAKPANKASEVKSFINKFDEIVYVPKEDTFKFKMQYKKFEKAGSKVKRTGTVDIWTNGTRLVWNRQDQKYNVIIPTEACKKMLEKNGIDYTDGKDIRRDLSKTACDELIDIFFKTIKLTNVGFTEENDDISYVLSPVRNSSGRFYDSRMFDQDSQIPFDVDSNDALQIARKGAIVISKVKGHSDGAYDLTVSNEEWFEFVANNMTAATE